MIAPQVAASVWLAIGPALIAGSIGLIAACLSYSSAQRSLEHALTQAREGRAYQRDLLVIDRRLHAVELSWGLIYTLEATAILAPDTRDRVVQAVVWLPANARTKLLELLVIYGDSTSDAEARQSALQSVREALLSETQLSTSSIQGGAPNG